MCQKRVNWQRYTYSVLLLLLVVFVSNSSQQKQHIINTSQPPQLPQPFRYAKSVSENRNNIVSITLPTNHKRNHHADGAVGDSPQNDVPPPLPIQRSLATVTSHIQQSESRSIDFSLRELQNLLAELMIVDSQTNNGAIQKRSIDVRSFITDLLFDGKLFDQIQKFAETFILPSAALKSLVPTGARFFLFKGLKKWMGPLFIGVQIAKTVLLAMFLPSIIGSIGKMVGKGLIGSSGFGHPTETVEDFEFKDNPPPEEPTGTTGMGYNYPGNIGQQALAAHQQQQHQQQQQHAYGDAVPAANSMLSLYDIAEPKPQFTLANTYPMPSYAQNSRKETFQSKKDDFKVFHDIPASSMLLTNYDPFYSPLLSRLDAVFNQLNLNGDNEACREKLVCLMYASPAKYMPYSNLVSAQLSRELNELRKPTSDNVEILRFFKYMRAARDGQDGKNCHNIHKKCSSFTDTEQPAMLTTFNDINKLVQARNMEP